MDEDDGMTTFGVLVRVTVFIAIVCWFWWTQVGNDIERFRCEQHGGIMSEGVCYAGVLPDSAWR
jgi:hypothetical protein